MSSGVFERAVLLGLGGQDHTYGRRGDWCCCCLTPWWLPKSPTWIQNTACWFFFFFDELYSSVHYEKFHLHFVKLHWFRIYDFFLIEYRTKLAGFSDKLCETNMVVESRLVITTVSQNPTLHISSAKYRFTSFHYIFVYLFSYKDLSNVLSSPNSFTNVQHICKSWGKKYSVPSSTCHYQKQGPLYIFSITSVWLTKS